MDDLYDEFGNFIGEAEESDEESQNGAVGGGYVYDEDDDEVGPPNDQQVMQIDGRCIGSLVCPSLIVTTEDGPSNAVVLHEDKQYYPTAQQIYGADVETLVQEEDAQPLTQPIIAPVQQKKFAVQEADLPPVYFARDFMTDLMNFPEQIRNIAFAGHLHHGKTALMDMLARQEDWKKAR
ncbi:MAG: hypothetical protein L6R38_009613 [Xanthoria sp. 2 TBL-2021]|nr:MAG: hypothetical protein L6R38_009613 [Xanthoria sp. 2 TBL-2021]